MPQPAATPALLFAMSLNSRLKSALRALRTCVLHLEAGEPRDPVRTWPGQCRGGVLLPPWGWQTLTLLMERTGATWKSPTWELMCRPLPAYLSRFCALVPESAGVSAAQLGRLLRQTFGGL